MDKKQQQPHQPAQQKQNPTSGQKPQQQKQNQNQSQKRGQF